MEISSRLWFRYNNLCVWVFVRVYILLTFGKHLYDHIISIREEIWAHEISLAQPIVIEVPVPSQESEHSCISVLELSIVPLSTILIFDFEIVPTVWCFLFFNLLSNSQFI